MNKTISRSSKLLAALLLVMALVTLAGGAAQFAAAQPTSVTLVSDLQDELGCSGDWQPECATTMLAEQGYGVWRGAFTVPMGDWNYKMALNGTWDVAYPADNIPLSLGAETAVIFYFDDKTNAVVDNVNHQIPVAAGTLQDELGCPGDWQPDCVNTLLTDVDSDGVYSFVTADLPAGDYEFKVAMDEAWDVSYPGSNVPFSVPGIGGLVTITWDSATTDVLVDVGPPPPPGGVLSVTIAGDLQDELGCTGDWDPTCAATHLGYDWDDDVWQGVFNVPFGAWNYKAALNDSWDENYGAGAVFDGPNIPLNLELATDVKFYYDHKSHWVTDNVNSVIATAASDFQSEIGCPGDWSPDCLRSWLQDPNGDDVYQFQTSDIPSGDYNVKVALDEAWDVAYPNDNIPFNVPAAGALVTVEYNALTNEVTVTVDSGVVPPEIADLVTPPVRDPIQDEVFYFVMPDRFDNGNPGNDNGFIEPDDPLVHGFNPVDKGFFHGGDLAGLEGKLDYLADMGTTAIWMTPVFENNPVQGTGADVSAGYHGYWYVDMTQFDPHFGTNAELETLITEAHNRGIKVFFDIITNHTADIIDYEEGTYAYRNKEDYPYLKADGTAFDDRDYINDPNFPVMDPVTSFPYTPVFNTVEDETVKVPAWLNDPIYYHNRGNSEFKGENSLYGDFFGLDDMFTEHPDVVQGMTEIYKSWITDYDIDGFRIDTVKHVNLEFWQEFVPAIMTHAESAGRTDFFVFGEVFSGNPLLLSHYTSRADFPAVLDFRFQEQVRSYASAGGNSDIMRDLFADDDYFTDADSNVYASPTFIGNHDRGRFGWFLDVDNAGPLPDDEKEARSKLATAMMFFARGVPVIYYGDEQGFVGDGGDKDARQDMMPSQVPSYNDDDLIGTDATTAVANFDASHPLYQSFSDFAAVLAAHPALGTGAQLHRWSQASPGIYAFSRIDRVEQVEYIVAFNNANSPQSATFGTDSPGTTFSEVYPGGVAGIVSDASGQVTVGLPAVSFAIYRADAALPASESAPGVGFNTLINDQEVPLETRDLDGNAVQDRIEVGVALTEDKFAEVTFAVRKSGTTDYAQNPFGVIGVDDNAPYRVFFSLKDVPGGFNEGDMLDFVAVVTDNNGNLSYAEVTGIKPIEVAPPEPPQPGEAGAYAIIQYYREDGDYGDHTTGDFNDYWGLHLWGDIDETIEWTAPKPFLGEDEAGGRFAWVKLAENASNVGFIVHRGDTKDGTDADRFFNPGVTPEIWLKNDDATAYTSQAAAQGFVTIHYHRDDGVYDGWGLYLWGDAIEPNIPGTDWNTPRVNDGVDDFGAFWNVPIVNAAGTFNYIIHNGDNKDPGPDQSFIPQEMPTVWIMSGDETIYPQQGAAQGFITLHYHRPAGDYGDYGSNDFNEFWGLHTWGDADDPGWTTPRKSGPLDTFGAVFTVELTGSKQEIGYILHRGPDEKDPGPDQALNVDEWGYEVWQLQALEAGVPNEPQYVYPLQPSEPGANPGNISQQSAYWVDEKTILWDVASDASLSYTLHYAANGGLEATDSGITGGDFINLGPGTVSAEVAEKFPHLADLPALEIPEADRALVPDILKGQIAVSAVNADGLSVDATGLQIPGVLDDLYTYSGELGISWDGGAPTISVWAPTAKSVALFLFADSDPATAASPVPMTLDPANGVWSITGDASWKGMYYLFDVEVFVHSTGQVEYNKVTDPYSFSLAMNSTRSQIVDLDDAALKPAGWDDVRKPELVAPEDISVYEIHMRDFSVNDPTVPDDLEGTYKAFTLQDSYGIKHLQALQEAGLSHLHLLPIFDIATINENKAEWQEEEWSVLEMYASDSDQQQAAVTLYEDLDGFNWGYDPFHYTTPEGSYSTEPDGPARIVEFREMVQAINEDIGLRVVMDVVYNHTNAAGQDEKSVLDRIVPGYYHRLNDTGAVETSTCCQNTATEHNMMEKLMVDSLVVWARDYKVDAFRFDLMGHHMKRNMIKVQDELAKVDTDIYIYGEGWNFGEVADNARGENATQLNMAGTGIGTFSDRLRDAVRGGSPFDGGADLVCRQGFANGLYYDPNYGDQGEFVCDRSSDLDTLLLLSDQIRVGMAGNLAGYEFIDRYGNLVTGAEVDYNGQPAGYTQDPQEDITYISKHDNQTLYDNNTYKIPLAVSMEDRVRVQNVGLSTVLLGQGVPFMHAGSDLLRSKSLDRDSFNSGDWFNKLDFSYQDNNFGVGLPVAGKNQDNWPIMEPFLANPALKADPEDIKINALMFQELLAIRESSPLFRLQTAEEVMARVVFHNTGSQQVPGLIVMSIIDRNASNLDDQYKIVFVLVNANDEPQSFTIGDAIGGYIKLHPVQADSVDEVVQTSSFDPTSGTFVVPGRTTAVFVSYEHVEDMIGDLIGQIEDLVDQGVLNNGQGQSLTNMLDRALKELGKGNPQKAIKAMNDFIKRINNLSKRGVLSEETAAQLIKDAQIIIAAIEAGA